ncbi:globin domain-containing protein [Pseudomonas sp. 2FE]|uniref:globin domain-containing protein n=1 Tax=Pseudomonas sp. 2FE TaxID=2502190 RepID=UPI0010F9DF87|nr:globin domain-containing protein [Pseudomonas sp. 2FE]
MAIDNTAVQLIKQTAGAIREKSQEINQLVYENLSKDHKPAYAILQRAGLPSLAGIVASYAASIDNLEPFLKHAPKIARMHHRINLQEEHFEMVANALFSAFRQALGTEAISEAAIHAWRCAYEHLANTLITLQKEIQTPAL